MRAREQCKHRKSMWEHTRSSGEQEGAAYNRKGAGGSLVRCNVVSQCASVSTHFCVPFASSPSHHFSLLVQVFWVGWEYCFLAAVFGSVVGSPRKTASLFDGTLVRVITCSHSKHEACATSVRPVSEAQGPRLPDAA